MKLLCIRLQSQGFFVTYLAHDQDCASISIVRDGFPDCREILDFAYVNVSFFYCVDMSDVNFRSQWSFFGSLIVFLLRYPALIMSNPGPVATSKLIEDLTVRHFIAMWTYALQKNYTKTMMKLSREMPRGQSPLWGTRLRIHESQRTLLLVSCCWSSSWRDLDTLCYIFKVRPRLSFYRRIFVFECKGVMWSS